MKRFLTLSTSLLIVLVGCGISDAAADETGNAKTTKVVVEPVSILEMLTASNEPQGLLAKDAARRTAEAKAEADKLEAELARQAKLVQNAELLATMVKKAKSHIGTPYVPFGASPSGWDCSGMVRWAFAQIDKDLYHGASTQKHSGKMVKTPKVGDIVAFGWRGYNGAQHTGIYLGDGKMLHAGGYVGMRTEVADISDWAKGSGNTLVTYTRILPN